LPTPWRRLFPALALFLAAALPASALTFAVLGDNRPHKALDPQPEVFRRIVKEVNQVPVEFSVELGDKVLGSRVPSIRDRQYRDFLAVARGLEAPLHYTVGNHDLSGDYARIFGARYYSFDADDSHFIVLDAYQPGQTLRIAGKQYAWLERDLAAHKDARHTFVFTHAPLWPKLRHVGSSLDRYPKDRDRLAALLRRYGVKLVFVGHNHFYRRDEVGGITQFTSGGAGAELYLPAAQGGFHHFLVVQVAGPRVMVTLHRLGAAPKVVYDR